MPVAQWEVEVGVGGALCRIEGDAHAVADLAGADRLPARTRDLVLFKVVIRDLGKPVRPKVSGQDKLSGVQAICTHRMLRLDPATETCIASTTPALTNSEFEPVTLQLSSLPTEALKSIRTWKQSSDLAVHMAAHMSLPSGMDPDTAAEVVRVLAQTTSGTLMAAFDGDADQRAVIDFFLKDGMIQGPPFTFTMKGMENIEVSVNLTADTLVANMKLEDIADEYDLTTHQLITLLGSSGFQHRVLEDKDDIKQARGTEYIKGSDSEEASRKTWYSLKGKKAMKFYLHALLQHEDGEIVEAVPHLRGETAYKKLLGLVADVPKDNSHDLALEDDFSAPVVEPKPRPKRKPRRKLAIAAAAADDGGYADDGGAADDGDSGSDGDSSDSSSSHNSSSDDSGSDDSNSSDSSASDDSSAAAPPVPVRNVDRHQGNMSFGRHRLTYYADKTKAGNLLGGYQMTCKTHAGGCTKSCKIPEDDVDGGELGAIRRLKYWASMSTWENVNGKAAHKNKWDDVLRAWEEGSVPSMAELDAQQAAPAAAPANEQAAPAAKRQRRNWRLRSPPPVD